MLPAARKLTEGLMSQHPRKLLSELRHEVMVGGQIGVVNIIGVKGMIGMTRIIGMIGIINKDDRNHKNNKNIDKIF